MNVLPSSALRTNYSDPDMREIIEKIITPYVEREKAGYMERQTRIAKRNHELGSQWQEAMGQKVASVDGATFIRWQQWKPGCWDDPGFIKQFLAANPECACKTRSW